MAQNFHIKVVNQNNNIVFKLRGDVDGSSAAMILERMEDYQGLPVILDFSGVKKYYPFGLHILKWAEQQRVDIKVLKDTMQEERRHFPRVYTPPIVLYRFEDKHPPLGVKRFDVSEGGIRLLLPEDPKGKVIQLMIYLSDHPISVKGKAVWIKERETKEGRFFETGLEFTKLEQPDKTEIESFIMETLSYRL